ncbi:16S rRNA (guanine(966)-N(2))-methyltransferase RsmD [Alkalicoccobacillus plakortidis]|uniref:16S rRNA (Guanine(966)-N(2))-methyltransferase RsmD n=1 Tax=Alkalicoccobacillus plakortidis TaxID=444060 RepID=A0ABT0XG09_9BACI|nr:16S rRNA (guanine(966)-N(2))-methyltransferase RsmD [Alkalicoccobacillus plakortidis]MCM2674841.1 16S rRNA (guanine(966)-N(2))-methyltransferase RsmD [Alkalicoccobacillus plakortidis]
MRVISGEKKGLPLKAVSGKGTRPTTDKVKESIFNMIGPYFNGGSGLDLYAGSGGLGIEGISRGLESVIFVDQDKKAIQTIHSNLEFCRFEEKAEVYRTDADRALKAIIKRELSFTCIFLDPPYAKQTLLQHLETIEQHQLLAENGVIVIEHASSVSLPDACGELNCTREEQYGDTVISIWTRDSLSGSETS